MVNIKIDNKAYSVEENSSILEAARKYGIIIPSLCYLKKYGANSSCRICLVKLLNQNKLVPACSTMVFDGMEISTKSAEVIEARKTNLELLLSNHNYDCKNCVRNNDCELQLLVEEYGADPNRFKGEKTDFVLDVSNPALIRDNSKCILCKKCVDVCSSLQSVNAIKSMNRGFKTQITCAFDKKLNSSSCVGCGQCIMVCPTGALTENFNIKEVLSAIQDKNKFVVVAPAPSVRVGLGEEFSYIKEKNIEKKLPTILKRIGFDRVFDVNFAADLTIIEESQEFIERYSQKKNLPLITSCCPGWVDFAGKFFPELLPNISSTKSPQEMFGAVIKSYYASKMNLDSKNIVVVSVMPCVAKKKELTKSGYKIKDVDYSLTVRELASIIRYKNIDINKLEESEFDSLLGESSGAGVIFGASGGVMEAAIRTLADTITKTDLEKIDYEELRGFKGIKISKVQLGKNVFNLAVVSGLSNAKELMNQIKNKKIKLDFVEVMACPGGCVNGGGMPRKTADEINYKDEPQERAKNLYYIDKNRKFRKSHLNPSLIKFYEWQKKAQSPAKLHIEYKR